MADITPSHPNFDRSGLTDAQFIEQLLFEIKELKWNMSKMQLELEQHKTAAESRPGAEQPKGEPPQEVPQRSARRGRNGASVGLMTSSVDSRHSSPERVVIEEVTGVAQSPSVSLNRTDASVDEILKLPIRQRLGTATIVAVGGGGGYEASPRASMTSGLSLVSSVGGLTDVDALAVLTSTEKTTVPVAPEKSHSKHQSDEVLRAIENQLDQINYRQDEEDMEFISARRREREGREKSHNKSEIGVAKDVSGATDRDEASSQSSVYSEETRTPSTPKFSDGLRGNTYPETSTADTTLPADKSMGSIDTYRSSDGQTLKPVNSTENSEMFQHMNHSSSSFHSYRSRIKLPPTLQQQATVQAAVALGSHPEAHTPQQPASNQHQPSVIASPASADSHFLQARFSPSMGSNEPPRIPLPVSPDDTKTNVLSPNRGLPSSKTFRDLNIQNLKVDVPPRINEQTLRSPAVINSGEYRREQAEVYHESPGTPEAFYINADRGGLDSTNSSPYQAPIHHTPAFQAPVAQSPVIMSPVVQSPGLDGSSLLVDRVANGSSFLVNRTMVSEEEEPLFIKPEEFQTIVIHVLSTISPGNSGGQASSIRKLDEIFITIAVEDRSSGKEMWRIKKSWNQLVAFDNEIRPTIEYFGLPILPDKSLFFSTTPNKIDVRINGLQNYFNTLFVMPHIPHLILFRICKYLSLDFINPLDEFKSGAHKEGYLVRKYKGLGSSWKVRWCQVDGSFLELYDTPGGSLIEQINLSGCQIGRQSNDTVAEEKGYRHAFLIMESQKTSKLSSSAPKHFFCAESDEERDEWVDVLIEFSSYNDYEETPRTQVDYQDEIDYKAIKSPAPLMVSYQTVDSNEKKKSKRSIFPFRNKALANLSTEFTDDSIAPTEAPQATPEDHSMQLYLDKMGLDEQMKQVFGRDIRQAYEVSHHSLFGRDIPSVCYRCLEFLLKTGAIHEEGIFRLSGSASTIRQLKDMFNKKFDVDLFELKPDIHTVAGLFKTYLRELPSPILGEKCYNDLRQIIMKNGNSSRTALMVRDHLNNQNNIDKIHYDVSFIIFKFLKEIINNKESNKMNLKNVCIVFVPTLNISLDVLSLLLIDFACIFENREPVADEQRERLDLNIPNF